MAQNPFDQLSKQYLEEFLAPLGAVQRQYEVPGESKFVDVWFIPHSDSPPTTDLGLLGRMAQTPCLFEAYRNVPTRTEVRVAVMKLVWVQEDERRKAHREELPEEQQPMLWILAATTSRPLLQAGKGTMQPDWPTGVYFVPDLFKTAIVAIDQLPVIPETLLLRVLGRENTQQQAIEEVIALPMESPQRQQILRLVASWKVRIDLGELAGFVQGEEIMSITQAFVTWEQETQTKARQEGRQEGRQEKEVEIALNMLRKNLALEIIAEVTGLTIAQLQALQSQN
jgi:hypothetical protein